MGRTPTPCCLYAGLNKGPWTPEEDLRLIKYIEAHGQGNWRTLPNKAGLQRCGKGCRLRWMNYLRPNVKRGHISSEEEEMIIRLHKLLGNRWSLIAGRIPGRTDNEVKNYWNTHLRKKFNAIRGLRHSAQTVYEQTCSDKSGEGGTRTPYIKEKGSLCCQGANSNRHMVKDQNQGSDSWCIGEIVSNLQGAELEPNNCRANVAQIEADSIENLNQWINGFNDPAFNMDLINRTISHIPTTWPHGSNHRSSYLPNIYTQESEPNNMTWPSDSMVAGLYDSMPETVTSLQRRVPQQLVDNFVSANCTNSRDKPIGDVSMNNIQWKTSADPQIYTTPAYGFTMDDFSNDQDIFDQYGNMVLPEFDQLDQNLINTSCLQAEYPKTDQCSEPWLSSFLSFDGMERLYS